MDTKRILTVALVVGLAFVVADLAYVDNAEAFPFIIIPVAIGVGMLAGWLLSEYFDDSSDPNYDVYEEQISHAYWNETINELQDQYNLSRNDDINMRLLYDNTYLAAVRYAENEVASYVNCSTWADAKANMTSFDNFNQTARHILLYKMGNVGYTDCLVLDYAHHADYLSFIDLEVDGSPQSTFSWGVQAHNNTYNGSYIGEYFLNYVYVPKNGYIVVDGTNYTGGNTGDILTFVSMSLDMLLADEEPASYNITDYSDGCYINGLRVDFPINADHDIGDLSYHTGEWVVYSPATNGLYAYETIFDYDSPVHVDSLEMYAHQLTGANLYAEYRIRCDGTVVYTDAGPGYPSGTWHYEGWISVDQDCSKLEIGTKKRQHGDHYHTRAKCTSWSEPDYSCGYFYRLDNSSVVLNYTTLSNFNLNTNLSNRNHVYSDFWNGSFSTIYSAMNSSAYSLWNYYRCVMGWENPGDIPSDNLIIYPDWLMSNLDALAGLNVSEFLIIYYVLLQQFNDSVLWNGTLTDEIDSTLFNISDFSDTVIKATLVHSGSEVFNQSWVWMVVYTDDLNISTGTTITLNQTCLFFEIENKQLWLGYAGDNLTIHEIKVSGSPVGETNLTITTLSAFLSATYGIDLEGSSFQGALGSLFGSASDQLILILGLVGVGVVCSFSRKLKVIGFLAFAGAAGLFVYWYVWPYIEPVIDFFRGLL